MNIFKVLNDGYGTVNENNVSGFLGYLLNPNRDHGLNDAFLKEFLSALGDDKLNTIFKDKTIGPPSLAVGSNYFVDVSFEKVVSAQKKKRNRVDIILKISSRSTIKKPSRSTGKNPSKSQNIDNLFGSLEPIALILIEVKVSDGAAQNHNQVEAQLQAANEIIEQKYKPWKGKIFSIFVAPDGNKCRESFKKVKEKFPKNCAWVVWKQEDVNDDTEFSIFNMLTNVLKNESESEIEPIDDYAKHSVKAFANFIRDSFKKSSNDDRLFKDLEAAMTDKDSNSNFKAISENENYKNWWFDLDKSLVSLSGKSSESIQPRYSQNRITLKIPGTLVAVVAQKNQCIVHYYTPSNNIINNNARKLAKEQGGKNYYESNPFKYDDGGLSDLKNFIHAIFTTN